jgi:4-alpha-glucanotransferase
MRYTAAGKRLFGIAIPLASIRTRDGWRVGEYPDLVPFARFCAVAGAGLVQILPVNDTGSQSSPYSALSAFALHPLYIRVKDLPEASNAPEAIVALELFAEMVVPGERFQYDACLKAKLSALRAVYDASRRKIASDPELHAFMGGNAWVKAYSVFKRLKSSHDERSWRDWPENRDPAGADIESLWNDSSAADEQLFHAWVQMRAAGQFSMAAREIAALGIVLLGDIPILINDDSADVWSKRSYFDASMRAGAPPDMYSATGQNWGFPIWDWNAMAADGYSFWKARIAAADSYYTAYRIDHVLGFFRIWALGDREETGSLGRFIPGPVMSEAELRAAGFAAERLRWLSEPHIPGTELRSACATGADADLAAAQALDRIGSEDLFLFKRIIRGEADIGALGLGNAATAFLKSRWTDRALLAIEPGSYAPAWLYRQSRAWASLSEAERSAFRNLVDRASTKAELGWEIRGSTVLAMLESASKMLPCAEDLGAVPDCVPRVLGKLGIPGLRVPRWMRRWDEPGQPFKALETYGELSVCTPSVHDTSTLRDWWEHEDGRVPFAHAYCPDLQPIPDRLDAHSTLTVLKALAKAPSMLYVVPMQDVLDTAPHFMSEDTRADRINVPGSVDGFNWTWRMRPDLEDVVADTGLIAGLRSLGAR